VKQNRLRELLDAGQPTVGTHIQTTWATVVEVIGETGLYDYMEFQGEYAPYDLYALDNLCRAAELYDMSSMIKVDQEPRSFLAQRAIGAGFRSVLFADCRSPEDVRDCVRIVRPDTPEDKGTYGIACRRFAGVEGWTSPDYVQTLRDVVVVIMIEKAGTVNQLEEVLAVEGVDMIQWGPADYSMSIGRAGEGGSPDIKEVERRVIEAALDAGIPPRAEIRTADEAKYYLDMGVRHFCVGTDVSILFDWWRSEGESLRKAITA